MNHGKLKTKIDEMSLKGKIYVSKIILAAIATLGCFILTLTQIEHSQAWGVGFGWSLVVIHFLVVWKVVKIDLNEIGGKGKILTEGFGTYVFIWLLLWTTVHTIWWISVYGIPIFYP
ncbi:MAG: hypothetical protein HWN67_23665 [Candidatus Helarchaeota archaeon]|nr:hypothetical protein [Candidatus Helarchaeota archaeon]